MSNILDLYILRNGLRCSVSKKGFLGSETIKELDISIAFNDAGRKGIIEALSGLKNEYGIKNTRVYLPFHLCLFSVIDLPLKRTSDVKDALPFELAGSLPLPIDEYLYDFDITDRAETSSRVMALSVRKNLVSDITSCMNGAGLAVSTIRCDLMEKLSSMCSARRKESFVFVDHSQEDIYIATVIKGVCSSIKRVGNSDLLMTEVENIRNLNQIRDVFLEGAVTDEIRKEINASVVDLGKQKKTLSFGTSYRFEFYKPEMSEEYRARQKKYVLWTVLVSGVFIMAGFIFPVYRDYAKLNNVNKEIREIKSEASELLDKSKQLDENRRKLTFLKKKRINSQLYVQVLAEITGILPKDSWIMSFDIDEKGFIELKGFADDATKMIEILEESRMFKNASFSGPMLKSNDKTRYSVKMELER